MMYRLTVELGEKCSLLHRRCHRPRELQSGMRFLDIRSCRETWRHAAGRGLRLLSLPSPVYSVMNVGSKHSFALSFVLPQLTCLFTPPRSFGCLLAIIR